MVANRRILGSIPSWIEDDFFRQSVFQYGVPEEIRGLLDRDVGNEINYADSMLCLAKHLTGRVSYLEIGVSVGKTFLQMLNGLQNGLLVGMDIENLSPILADRLEQHDSVEWPTPVQSLRKQASRETCCRFPSRYNDVRYLAADVFDEQAWRRLRGTQFNLVFSDAFHSPDALRHEFRMIDHYDLLDPHEFVLVWDDLHGSMRDAFEEIGAAVCRRHRLPPKNQFVLPLRGWLGVNETPHPVGFVLNLPVASHGV
jgi:hypothetical protein